MTPLARPGAIFTLFAALVIVLMPVTVSRAADALSPPSGASSGTVGSTSGAVEPTDAERPPIEDGTSDAADPDTAGPPGVECVDTSLSCLAFSGYEGETEPMHYVDANGHSSTNYVVYRVRRAADAVSVELRYPFGNAGDWDTWVTSSGGADGGGWSVATTPQRGDVAQWDQSATYPYGHVAYVESIEISEDGRAFLLLSESFYAPEGGTGDVRRMFLDAEGWPKRFLRPGTARDED